MKNYVKSVPFSEKGGVILKLNALCVVAFAQCAQKGEKTIAPLWISSIKNFFLIV